MTPFLISPYFSRNSKNRIDVPMRFNSLYFIHYQFNKKKMKRLTKTPVFSLFVPMLRKLCKKIRERVAKG